MEFSVLELLHQLRHRAAGHFLRQRRGDLVQQCHAGLAQQRPGGAEELALALRQRQDACTVRGTGAPGHQGNGKVMRCQVMNP